MRKSLFILSCAALGVSLSAACSSDDGNDDAPVAGAPGDGDGDDTNDIDTDTDDSESTTDSTGGRGGAVGDGDGDGDQEEDIDCSSEVWSEEDGVGGAGGAGGAGAVSCEAPAAPSVDIAIVGTYTDNWGGTHIISTETWDTGYLEYPLSLVDNQLGLAVARNPVEDAFNPCMWSRFVWTQDGDDLYYCQAPYNAVSECAALQADLPDTTDLGAGCNGFSWSELIPSE